MKNTTIRAICGLVFFIFSAFVNAETLSEALASCQSNDDSLQRLVCYDKLAKNVKRYEKSNHAVVKTSSASASQKETSSAAVAKSNPPQQQASQPVESASSTVSTFGLEQRQEEEADRIDAKVAEVSEGVRGEMIITLDSGMVWRQVSPEAGIRLETGQEIYIEKGMFGSFYLSYEDINRRIKVKRIK
ncbi:hypothetical protein CA267_006830 [Alteromonas pelagimontana]|uniref:Uncharacterized protein n=1 Tax=Alteromonas pelagimontana TaxID=1858656 RepID=A0A6M4MBV3_9ALTE|nr:hypothetical protein [Alteromonas pelagimontana]QJR80509.1 hypothetical protein CA267_006830 [Alteromonas pelagimontana]